MKTLRFALMALVAVALFALTACAGPGEAPPTPPTGNAGATPPTIEIVTPLEGDTLPAGAVTVKVNTTDLEFTMPSNTNAPGQGHVHFTLDDEPFEMSTEPQFTFEGVAPGTHTLKAEVVQNNTESFDPPIEQVITFSVK